ncbi:MAG: hypothetical protein JNK15_12100 [Planctomycetes bacterium]|nr:hypothetical protein [Planctomycetota bacterium]
MSQSKVSCEKCGVLFTQSDEVASTKVLCPTCLAERRAQLRAQKQGAAAPAAAAAAPAAAARPGRVAGGGAAPAKKERAAQRDHLDVRKLKEAESQKLMKIAWGVTGGIGLIMGIILLFVKMSHTSKAEHDAARAKWINDFKSYLAAVNQENVDAIDAAHKRIENEKRPNPANPDDVSGWLGSEIDSYVKTVSRTMASNKDKVLKVAGLVTKLGDYERQLNASPSGEALAKLYNELRAAELQGQATDAGPSHKTRYEELRRKASNLYIDALRSDADKALASATSGEGLAVVGLLEQTLQQIRAEAGADAELSARVSSMLVKLMTESDTKVTALFDEAYIQKQPWIDLFADKNSWLLANSGSSFNHTFGAGLVLKNPKGEDSKSGGLSYTPADKWFDYVLEIEFTVESGVVNFYTRVGDAMDTKMCPAFTVGNTGKNNLSIELGKQYTLTVTVIGNAIRVTGGEAVVPYEDTTIGRTKSRWGEPGVVAQANVEIGTNATITKMRARKLR